MRGDPAPYSIWTFEHFTPGGCRWVEHPLAKVTARRIFLFEYEIDGPIVSIPRQHFEAHGRWARANEVHRVFYAERLKMALEAEEAARAKLRRPSSRQVGDTVNQAPIDPRLALLDLPRPPFTRGQVLAAFRGLSKKAHPDQGGSDEAFRRLIAARDYCLRLVSQETTA